MAKRTIVNVVLAKTGSGEFKSSRSAGKFASVKNAEKAIRKYIVQNNFCNKVHGTSDEIVAWRILDTETGRTLKQSKEA